MTEKVERARRRIEAALKIAHDPRTIPADRDAAVAGAERMIANNDLDRAEFRFPGDDKVKTPPRSRFRSDLFEREHSPFFKGDPLDLDELNDIMERFRRHMGEGAAQAAKAEREAREARAAFEEEIRRSQEFARADRERRKREEESAPANRAASFLWSKGVKVYPWCNLPERLWIIPDESGLNYTDEGIIEVARARGFERDNVKRAAFGGQLDDLDEAIYFLRARGFTVETIPDSDYYSLREPGRQPEIVQARRVILSAKLRGFGS